jgi:hypothetical protein
MKRFLNSCARLPRVGFAVALTAVLGGVPLLAGKASAEVVQLTGGDPSGGLALNPATVVVALYTPTDTQTSLFPAATQVFQGVTFSSTAANVARAASPSGVGAYLTPFVGNVTASTAGFTNASSPTTEDTNLLSLFNAGGDFNTQYMTYTISNLAPATSYRVDTLASVLGYNGNRSYTVSYNGGLVSGTLVPASSTYLYAFKDIVNSTGAGEIVVTYQNLTGDGPTVSGLVVSAVPEPSTCVMALAGLACGGYSMFRRRKKQA